MVIGGAAAAHVYTSMISKPPLPASARGALVAMLCPCRMREVTSAPLAEPMSPPQLRHLTGYPYLSLKSCLWPPDRGVLGRWMTSKIPNARDSCHPMKWGPKAPNRQYLALAGATDILSCDGGSPARVCCQASTLGIILRSHSLDIGSRWAESAKSDIPDLQSQNLVQIADYSTFPFHENMQALLYVVMVDDGSCVLLLGCVSCM